jgi:SPOR domain
MADNNFRPFRSRDPLAREDIDPTSDAARDPLAELARIIGQSNRLNDFDRDPRHDSKHQAVQTLDEPLPAADRDWAADDGYAEPDAPEPYPEQHQDQYAEENFVQPRLPDLYPADRARDRYDRDDERAPPIASQYSEPAEGYDDPHDDESAYDPRYRSEEPPRPAGRQPTLAPQTYDDEYEAEGQWDDQTDRQSDDAEDYAGDPAARPRRSGLVMVLAMLGLVMIGAGGAFAYRTMFGGAILAPSLPPVIKANDAPNKIVPNRTDAQAAASNPAGAATPGASDKLVSREEQPVTVQPANAPPRVVSTIPVPPAPGAAPASPPAAGASALPSVPAQPSAPPKAAGPAQPPTAPLAGSGEPKKVHTVTIRSDQVGNANAAAAPAPAAPAPAARPRSEAPARATAPKGGGNAPLAIVPVAQGAAPVAEPPPRSRVARTEAPSAPVATAPAAAPAAGGYAVQVTSQRSEAEAESEFKTLQAKFPGQLGSRQPIIHRADLGNKGTFYRALVGPFASSEAAAAMCSNLKAAGGSCIVQKN